MNADVWIVERLFGLEILPAYVAQTKVVFLVSAVAGLVQQMMHPYIARAWSENRKLDLEILYKRGIFASWLLASMGYIAIYFITPIFMDLWIGHGAFLGNSILLMQICFGLICMNHIAFAYPVFATGKNPFLMASVINALLALPLSIIFGMHYGIRGVILGNIIGTLFPSIWVIFKSHNIFLKNHLHKL